MALLKKANTWYAYFRDLDGRQVLRTLHTGDRDIAIVRERAMRDMIREVKFRAAIQRMRPDEPQITTAFPKKQAPSPGEHQRGGIALDKMLECAAQKRDIATEHISAWKKFVAAIPVKYADEVTPEMAQDYLDTHYGNRGNGKTYNNIKGYLNTVFRCCLVEAKISQSPFAPIVNRKVKKSKSKPWRNLTLDEFDLILNDAPEYMQIMMMLSRWTAQRLETCARMTPEMFDFQKLVFVIDPKKNRRFNQWVCCPILPELEKFIKPILKRCPDQQHPIVRNFTNLRNRKLSESFTDLLNSHGIRGTSTLRVGFHSIRGTAITWYKEHGIQGEELRSITGHTTLKMEDKYARPVQNISAIAQAWKSK